MTSIAASREREVLPDDRQDPASAACAVTIRRTDYSGLPAPRRPSAIGARQSAGRDVVLPGEEAAGDNIPDAQQAFGSAGMMTSDSQTVMVQNDELVVVFSKLFEVARHYDVSMHSRMALLSGFVAGLGLDGRQSDAPRRENPDGKIYITKKKLSDIRQFVHGNLGSKIDLADLCEVTGLSASYLCRVMKLATGESPYHYVQRVRIDYAREKLASTQEPLVEIALSCGFSNQAHFCTTFKKFTGQTPGQFRRINANSSLECSEG